MVETRRDEYKSLQKLLITMVIWCFVYTHCCTFVIAEGRKWHWKGWIWLVSNLRSFAYKFSTLQSTLFKCSYIFTSSFSHFFYVELSWFIYNKEYMCVCLCACVCVCVFICMYVYMHIYEYIHAYVLLSFKLSNMLHDMYICMYVCVCSCICSTFVTIKSYSWQRKDTFLCHQQFSLM